ncbi:hypothetical protein [Virgibacillus halodenitrificans]|uniref:hypothetical protein n=1 Tax=Virgibacillus halodenitrificans TaxID=1482 RepID=UPI0013CE7F8F|nr:hypothetical protein [Virgibacillus halodenitrificans]
MCNYISKNRIIDAPIYNTKENAFADLTQNEIVVSDGNQYRIIKVNEQTRYHALGYEKV